MEIQLTEISSSLAGTSGEPKRAYLIGVKLNTKGDDYV
jgi:hypothetical protein